jgi:glucose/arabinose dehydrogenase
MKAEAKSMWVRMGAVAKLASSVACTESIPSIQIGDATVGEDGGSDASPLLPEASSPDVNAMAGPDGSPMTIPDASPNVRGALPFSPDAAPPAGSFCALPGTMVWTSQGPMAMPAPTAPVVDITWLHLPTGFCAHYFATVKTARQLKFAPGGELFAASPSAGTTGGAGDGISGIVVLPDDDHDGNADDNITFLGGLPAVQGLMFANDHFYYQDDTNIRRVPYGKGDRKPSGPSELVTQMTNWRQAAEHWPKVFDQALDGTIYITNGGSQSDPCDCAHDVRGAIVKLNADGTTSLVAKGFRNPIAMRCEANHSVCLAVELALDYSASAAGREKLVPVRQGDDWGFPCCATQNIPYGGVTCSDTGALPDCSGVAQESDAFVIGHTPFGVDFETGLWPAPWNGRAFVTLHGVVGTYEGARVVAIALDETGMPNQASEVDPALGNPNSMLEFATGWDDGLQDHGRPAPIAFAPDGRMFIGDDQKGAVIWIAPVELMQQ